MIASFPQNSSTPNSNPNISMGIGGQQPVGMGMFGGFPQIDQYSSMSGIMGGFQRPRFPQMMQRPQPMNYSGYGGMQRPQQNFGYGGMQGGGYQQSPYQQPYPQPQQYGGYGMSQGYGGQSSFAPMSNPYQPQQYGNNPNNLSGYGQQPAQQFY